MTAEPPFATERVSHYRILHRLGSGGMGDVYAGIDETLQRRVALKAIRAEHRLNSASQVRFLREARILSQLDHPNICRAYDYIEGDGSDWLVLELIEGSSLKHLLDQGPLGSRTTGIVEQIAAVLVVTHAAGVVHRDLKPANVMITPSGQVKVLDFGIARSLASPSHASPQAALVALDSLETADVDATRTSEGAAGLMGGTQLETDASMLGTLAYMSPEQIAGEAATSASDMFSFGLLLQEVLTGRRAYAEHLDPAALIDRVRNARTEPPAGVASDFAGLIERLTSLAPSQRPTAVETVDRLRWIREKSTRWLRRAALTAALVVVAAASAKYTVDLRRERTAAVLARDDANRRRGQAEELIGFMLGDLRSKLQKAGRLDLLEAVGGQAMAYFAAVPAASLTGEELSQRAQAIYQIGAVRQQQGNLKAASAAFEESLALARQVAARDPSNTDWQLRLATAHFYLGDAKRRQNDLDGAMPEFIAYRDIAERLVERDRGNLKWALELSYAHGGIAAVQELQGDLPGARRGLEFALGLKEQIAAREPASVARQQDLATAHNRLGVVLDKLGDTAGALRHYQADLDIRKILVNRDPTDQSLKRAFFVAIEAIGDAYEQGGRVPEALEQRLAALEVAAALAAHDRANVDWQRDWAVAERFLADALSFGGRLDDARSRYQHARTVLEPIAAADATDVVHQRDLAWAELGLGSLELRRGNVAAARAGGAAVERLLAPFAVRRRDDTTIRVLAEGRLLAAAASGRLGDAGAAALRESALQLTRSGAGTRDKRLRATEVRALLALGRLDEARPIARDLVRLGYRHPWLAEAWRASAGTPLGPGG